MKLETDTKKAKLSASDIELIADAINEYGCADIAADTAQEKAQQIVDAVRKARPNVPAPVAYSQVVPAVEKRGYTKAWAQELVRRCGLRARKSSGKDGRQKNGGKNGNGKAKPITLRGNAKKAYDAVKSLKLTDKQIADLIAALTA